MANFNNKNVEKKKKKISTIIHQNVTLRFQQQNKEKENGKKKWNFETNLQVARRNLGKVLYRHSRERKGRRVVREDAWKRDDSL